MIRRATPGDAATVARLNAHVQGWHAAQYPDVFDARPDPAAVRAYFAGWLADPASTIFLAGDPAMGYAPAACSFAKPRPFPPPSAG